MADQKLHVMFNTFYNANKKNVRGSSNSNLSLIELKNDQPHQLWRSSVSKKHEATIKKVTFLEDSDNKMNILTNRQKDVPVLPSIHKKYLQQQPSTSQDEFHPDKKSPLVDSIKSDVLNKHFRNYYIYTCPPILVPSLAKYNILPSYKLNVTKKDQYKSMSACFLKHSKAMKKPACNTKEFVDSLMKKLNQSLKNCPQSKRTDAMLKRLQCFNNVFMELISNSQIFGNILKVIKTEYENYITYLLDFHMKEGQVLQREVKVLFEQHIGENKQLTKVENRVEELEYEMLDLLHESKRIQKEIQIETERINTHDTNMTCLYDESVEDVQEKKTKSELFEDVESIRISILEKMDELHNKQIDMHKNYVPVSVCLHLEQCIKDTEMELHKLIKQNEYYKSSTAEMEGYLKEAIVDADTSERDVRRIWRKIYSRRHLGDPVGYILNTNIVEEDNDDDDDDESKWNWYIS